MQVAHYVDIKFDEIDFFLIFWNWFSSFVANQNH